MALGTVPNKNPQASLEHSGRIENRWGIERWKLVEHHFAYGFVVVGLLGNHLARYRLAGLGDQPKDIGFRRRFLPNILDTLWIAAKHLIKGGVVGDQRRLIEHHGDPEVKAEVIDHQIVLRKYPIRRSE